VSYIVVQLVTECYLSTIAVQLAIECYLSNIAIQPAMDAPGGYISLAECKSPRPFLVMEGKFELALGASEGEDGEGEGEAGRGGWGRGEGEGEGSDRTFRSSSHWDDGQVIQSGPRSPSTLS
jgi:hypothetical protein